MKIKMSALVVLMSLSLVMSCGNDDDGGGGDLAPLGADFTYEGQEYSFNSGYSVDGIEPSFGYYNTSFLLGTNSFTLDESALPSVVIGDFGMTRALLVLNLLNEGNNFETGTYVSSQTELPKYFELGYIRLPGSDNVFNLEDIFLTITSGTVEVSGSPDNYQLQFNVSLSNGQSLNFNYDSSFIYVDAF